METTHDPDGGLVGLARRTAPHLDVVSASEAVIRSHNVVGFIPSAEAARAMVLELESMSSKDVPVGEPDSAIGVVVMGSGETTSSEPDGVDPEGVSGWLGPRVLGGFALGAVIGGSLGAGLAALFGGPVFGAMAGGAFLLGVFTAIWLTFAKLGGSEAYRQTFARPQASELTVVSLHTDDPARADAAFERLRQHPDTTTVVFDESLERELRRSPESA